VKLTVSACNSLGMEKRSKNIKACDSKQKQKNETGKNRRKQPHSPVPFAIVQCQSILSYFSEQSFLPPAGDSPFQRC